MTMDSRADEFVTQARDHLTLLEQILLSLEKPADPAGGREQIDLCLRLVHSLKGDAGFLGFSAIRILANAMENVFEALRHSKTTPPPMAIERLFEA
ncbi:Hpt domain-containing protein, partial [Singulisphaera rosea]